MELVSMQSPVYFIKLIQLVKMELLSNKNGKKENTDIWKYHPAIPNLFTLYGPQGPSVLLNRPTCFWIQSESLRYNQLY